MATRPRPATAGPRAAASGHRPAATGQRPAATDQRPAASHRRPGRGPAGDRQDAAAYGPLAWPPYLVVLAGVAAGMFVACRGPNYAAPGASILGGSLLVAALARLIMPPRYAGLLSTRRKASDVLTFAVFGAAVLAVALTLP